VVTVADNSKKKEAKHCTSNKGIKFTLPIITSKQSIKKKCSSSGVQQSCITHYITKNIEKITVHRVGIWSNDQNFTKIPFDEFALNHSKHHICTISKVCMVAVLGSNSYHVGFWKLRKHQTSFAQNGIKLSRKKTVHLTRDSRVPAKIRHQNPLSWFCHIKVAEVGSEKW